jgi:hypothetical protein
VFFALLVIVSENRDRWFGDETSISGSIVIAIASVVAFRESAPLFGPLVCAACAGLYWPHVRERRFDKVIVNASSIGFSALASAAVLEILAVDPSSSVGDWLILLVPAVVAYWLVNTCVLAVAVSLLHGSNLRRCILHLVRSESFMLGFALLGGLCGLLFSRSDYWAGAASAIALLVVLDVLVISPRRWSAGWVGAQIYGRVSPPVGAMLLTAFCVEKVGRLAGSGAAVLLVLVGTLLVAAVRVHRRIGVWDRHLALGVALADAPLMAAFVIAGVLAVTAGTWVAVAWLTLVLSVGIVLIRRRRRTLAEAEEEDVRLAAAVECAVLDGRDRSSVSR